MTLRRAPLLADSANRAFRRNVLRLLNRRRWTQARLADAAGIDRASLNRLLTGMRDPHLSTCAAIAAGLGLSLPDLLRPDLEAE